jgi:hypothetical protein
MAKRRTEVARFAEWRMPEEMVLKLGELTAEAEALQDRANSPVGV